MGTESECGGFTLRTLVETIVWCESNPGGDLRREATRPTSQFAAKNGRRVIVTGRAQAAEVIKDVTQKRAAALVKRDWAWDGRLPIFGGRILKFFPEMTLSDGSAESESEHFFDVHNQPPWDTWMWLESVRESRTPTYAIVCYVPFAFLGAADAGVYSNPESCLAWYV